MDDWGIKLLHGVHAPAWYFYPLVIVGSLSVRAIVCALRAWEITFRFWGRQFGTVFCEHFKGRVWENPIESDYCLPLYVGTLELFAFPFLMQQGAWSVLGAWVGFKTIAQFEAWTRDRNAFNRYLLSTAVVIFLSFFLARCVLSTATFDGFGS